MVHFEDPRFKLVIQEDVKAKNLEAHRVFCVVRLTRPICVAKHWLNGTKCLDDHRFNIMKNFFSIMASLLNVVQSECQTSFVTKVIRINTLVRHIVRAEFINRIVR